MLWITIKEGYNYNMKFNIDIKNFTIDKNRDKAYVDIEFYQMNLTPAVALVLKDESNKDLFLENNDFLPSWTKTVKNPLKAKGFITTVFQAIFEGKHNIDSLNVDNQFGETTKNRVDMVFFPGSTMNKSLGILCDIIQQSLQCFIVVLVNGETMSNATAEKKVKEAVEIASKKNLNVLIVSAGMAQRSFSVEEIGTVYLAYDGGSADATTQKLSRVLTPRKNQKVGRVVSLSFNPNRDDKFDDIIMESAENLVKNKGISINEAVKTVLRTISFKICTEDGAVPIQKDDYLNQLIESSRLDRVIGRVADFSTLSMEQIKAIASGKVDYKTFKKTNCTERGKTYKKDIDYNDKQIEKNNNEEKNLIFKARKVIIAISENIDIILAQGGKSIDEAFAIIDKFPEEEKKGIKELFGINYESLKNIVIGIMNKNLLELKFGKTK